MRLTDRVLGHELSIVNIEKTPLKPSSWKFQMTGLAVSNCPPLHTLYRLDHYNSNIDPMSPENDAVHASLLRVMKDLGLSFLLLD